MKVFFDKMVQGYWDKNEKKISEVISRKLCQVGFLLTYDVWLDTISLFHVKLIFKNCWKQSFLFMTPLWLRGIMCLYELYGCSDFIILIASEQFAFAHVLIYWDDYFHIYYYKVFWKIK